MDLPDNYVVNLTLDEARQLEAEKRAWSKKRFKAQAIVFTIVFLLLLGITKFGGI